MNWLKNKVSGTRRKIDNYHKELDLTYILNERLIVMSYPSSGVESKYRNHWKDVSIYQLQKI